MVPRIAARGRRFIVAYARDKAGAFPAEDFIRELESDKNRRTEHAGLLRLFQLYADEGRIVNREHFRQLNDVDPVVVEFKKFQCRVLGFFRGRLGEQGLLFLTHGFIKKQDKTPPAEIDRAHRIREEHLAATTSEKK